MRQRLLIVLMVLLMSGSARSEDLRNVAPWIEVPDSLVGQSLLKRDSLLVHPRIAHRDQANQPTFFLRSSSDSSRHVVRLVDEPAGYAYIGPRTHTEPEVPSEDFQFSPESLKGNAVAIDGAADLAERAPNVKEKELETADSRQSFAWIAGTGNQLGMLEWIDRDLAVYEYSVGDRGRFRVSPGFAMRWLTGPDTTDLPPYLFSIFADVGMGFRLSDKWVLDAVISPSWNTDFANKGYKLFRLPWQVVNNFQVNDEWKLVLGITDLAREDIRLLPVAGFSYAPSDGSKQFDLIFPRPRMAWRLSHRDEDSYWGYVAGELGGGSFSILRADRQSDIVTLRDFRLLFGVECRGKKRHASRIEAGWVFGRTVEYQSNAGNYHPGDTAIIRISSDY